MPNAQRSAPSAGFAISTAPFPVLRSQLSALAPTLRTYFYSGWAFFIPYLLTYLLYAWRKWPANPLVATSGEQSVLGDQLFLVPCPSSIVPCLLYVYWVLHALHLVLGSLALRGWWQTSGLCRATILDRLRPLLPWLCLGLIFYIPGTYLEFPADPWEHYARINHWRDYADIISNPIWTKSSYFLAYSLIGWIAPTSAQLAWANAYYTGCCLLLGWQYYRLARAIGLGERTSMAFVLLQALLLGNNIFGFYRYYGLSSTVFAQLGAVALIRLALEAATLDPVKIGRDRFPLRPSTLRALFPQALAGLGLVILTVYNHPQGLGIAALGLMAVISCRLIEWRCSMIYWLALTAVVLSAATILWYPRHPVLDAFNRPRGWLTHWYGFNLFSSTSPAYSRAVEIIGLSGLINLIGGLVLLRRNHIAGWLTIMPVLALSMPFVAIPFASLVAPRDDLEIQLFNRLLLSIPAGLALIVLGARITQWKVAAGAPRLAIPRRDSAMIEGDVSTRGHYVHSGAPSHTRYFWLVPVALCLLVLAPASRPSFNRLYTNLLCPPGDLTMRHVLAALEMIIPKVGSAGSNRLFIATPGISFVAYSTGLHPNPVPLRPIYAVPGAKVDLTQEALDSAVGGKLPALYLPLSAFDLYTPASSAGCLSLHWQPSEVAVEHSLRQELEQMATSQGYRKIVTKRIHYFLYSPN